MVVEEFAVFKKLIDGLLTDDERFELFDALTKNPEAGALTPGGGGQRKFRWGAGGAGKRGGLRVIYGYSNARDQLLFMYVYPKSKKSDLTREQVATLAKEVKVWLQKK